MKKYFQDIIPPEKRSIRNISITRESNREDISTPPSPKISEEPVKQSVPVKDEAVFNKEKFVYSDAITRKRKRPIITIWIVGAISLIALIFAIGSLGSKAIITIGVKTYPTVVAQSFDAQTTKVDGSLEYVALTVNSEKSVVVPASGEKDQKSKATGTIVVYNENTTSQKLIATTRFESADGHIYRIDKDITIAAAKTVSGKLVPGSIEAVVTADGEGEAYNKSNLDFTIPGLKGDARFKTVYARSKGAISGGSTAKIAVVKDEDLTKALVDIKAKLLIELEAKAKEQLPENTFTVSGLNEISYVVGVPTIGTSDKDANLKVQGSLKLYAINNESFAKMIVKEDISAINNFTVNSSGATGKITNNLNGKITFDLNGNVEITPTVKAEQIKQEIVGKSKADTLNILMPHKEFTNIKIVIKPFWIKNIPDRAEKIDIVVEKFDGNTK